jgi:hypothetical protein
MVPNQKNKIGRPKGKPEDKAYRLHVWLNVKAYNALLRYAGHSEIEGFEGSGKVDYTKTANEMILLADHYRNSHNTKSDKKPTQKEKFLDTLRHMSGKFEPRAIRNTLLASGIDEKRHPDRGEDALKAAEEAGMLVRHRDEWLVNYNELETADQQEEETPLLPQKTQAQKDAEKEAYDIRYRNEVRAIIAKHPDWVKDRIEEELKDISRFFPLDELSRYLSEIKAGK